jgi:hypothetical protein
VLAVPVPLWNGKPTRIGPPAVSLSFSSARLRSMVFTTWLLSLHDTVQ